MNIRKRILPPGWYPDSKSDVLEILKKWEKTEVSNPEILPTAGIVPHAGWGFSGETAFNVFRHFPDTIETFVVIGGHLPPGSPPLAFMEEGFETPLGDIFSDTDLLRSINKGNPFIPDTTADNTIEIQLPIIKYLFPDSRIVGIRTPPSRSSEKIGKNIFNICRNSGKRIGVIGSTDLTHYGYPYGFTPMGTGKTAEEWVRNKNDRDIIQALLSMDANSVISLANKKKAACSAGGATAAVSFAVEAGVKKGILLDYHTSSDISRSDSFVGYAGVLF